MPNEEGKKVTLCDFLKANGFDAKGDLYDSGSEIIEVFSVSATGRTNLWDAIKKYLTSSGLIFRNSLVFDDGGLDIVDGQKILAFIYIARTRSPTSCLIKYQYLNPR